MKYDGNKIVAINLGKMNLYSCVLFDLQKVFQTLKTPCISFQEPINNVQFLLPLFFLIVKDFVHK